MRLGITVDMSGAHPKLDIERVKEAERLGFSQAWTGEAYGTDAVTPATWMLANTTKLQVGTGIMQIPAPTPAMAAMTAMTLQHLSGGRFLCGLGVSGPQVIEGWHGTRFGKPMTRTKEYIAVMRQILERKGPLVFKGEEYEIPYAGPDATGLGKPLRSITHGDPALKFYLASITPAGLRTAGECADGVLPIFYSPEQPTIVSDPILAGKKKAGRAETMEGFDVAPYVRVKIGPDVAACRDQIRPELALYIGGMGARAKNYYNDVAIKLGFPGEAKTIQDYYLDGKKNEAAASVPDKLIDEISLCGPADRIRDRLAAWKDAAKSGHLGTMVLKGASIEAMRVVAEAGAVKTLLMVYHSATGGTQQMAEAAADAAAEPGVTVRLLLAADAGTDDMLAADGYIFATPENLAAMAGVMKDFFDRTYYAVLDKINGRPYATMICAGSDGENAARQIARIATGWRLRPIAPPLIVSTRAQTAEAILAPKTIGAADLARCAERGATFAAGMAVGIF